MKSLNEVRPEVVKMGDEEIRRKFSKSSKIFGKDEERNERGIPLIRGCRTGELSI